MRKSIAIFGEGITEWFYIDSLRIAGHYPFKMRPSIPQHSDIKHLLSEAKQCVNEGYDEIICLLDMDRLNTHPSEMQTYLMAKSQKAFRKVTFIESDPCTEYWFLMHFLPKHTYRKYQDFEEVARELRKFMPGYEKTKKYFQRIKLYEFISRNGSLENALQLSKKSEELHDAQGEISYSQMYKLFEKIGFSENKSKK